MNTLFAMVAVGLALIAPVQALAQAYPSRPITIVVPAGAGGGNDIIAREFGKKLSDRLGQPVAVENRPGAETLVALNHIAQSAPDGYTLLVTSAPFAIGPLILRAFKFDQINDLTHIGTVVDSPAYLYASTKAPFANLAELTTHGRANPGKLNMGTASVGNMLDAALLFDAIKIDVTSVNYPSGSRAAAAVLAGEVQLGAASYPALKSHVQAGTVRLLGTFGPTRSALTPDVPAIVESQPQFTGTVFKTGLSGPTGLPPEVTTKLNAELNLITKDPAIASRMAELTGGQVAGGTPEQWKAAFATEFEKYKKAVRILNYDPK
jgi:tripartite-type tricarboxylate transporter receptor subunit TctC